MNQKAEELKDRSAAFARMVIALCRKAPSDQAVRTITGQLIDAATSVSANYRATCRARSKAEFIAKMGLVVEEADESHGWLVMLVEIKALSEEDARAAIDEAYQLTAIFTASYYTAKGRRRRGPPNPQSPISE